MILAACPCGCVYYHPYELERGWCNYCETTRHQEAIRQWWPDTFTDELDVREAFAPTKVPTSAGRL